MIKKQAIELEIRELVPTDAKELLAVLAVIKDQSDFLTLDQSDLEISANDEANELAKIYDSPNNVFLGAFIKKKLVGTLRIHGDHHLRIRHIGEIGINVLNEFTGLKIGSALMADGIDWARQSQVIRRLELVVQKRNQKAVHLYQKYGFKIEGTMERGAISKTGDFLTVYLMSLLI